MSRMLLLAGTGAAAVAGLAHPAAAAPPAPSLVALRAPTAWGGEHTTTTGESVRITVSDALTPEQVDTSYWAEFVASLPHGAELARVTVYLAPEREVRLVCGFASVACYDPRRELIVTPAETVPEGLTLEAVLAHEYGHHVARNRLNPPWSAGAFGTKRWASYVGVCAGVRDGRLTPSGRGDRYAFDPAEVFAETYRMLAERRLERDSVGWQLVDASFEPDGTALALLARDVSDPWLRNTVLRRRGAGARTVRVATPLDGRATITIRSPRSAVYELRVPGRGRVRAPGAGRATIRADVCGTRALALSVRRVKGTGAFTLTISRP